MGKRREEEGNRRNSRPPQTQTKTTEEEEGGGYYYEEYDRSICLRALVTDTKGDEIIKWYVLNLSSRPEPDEEREEEKEVEEVEVGVKRLRRSNSKEAAYMAFNHSLGHLEDDVSQIPVLVPIPKLKLIPPRFNRLENPLIAGIGSNIYRLGGQFTHCHGGTGAPRLSRKVIYLDVVKKGKSKWRRGPSMNTGRSADGAQTVLLHGKLYVFGGVGLGAAAADSTAPAPWAEVFDGSYWTPLPPPPHSLVSSGLRLSGGVSVSVSVSVTDLVENSEDTTTTNSTSIVLLGFDCSTYTYNVMAKTWKTLDPHLFTHDALKSFSLRCGPTTVVANNTVYWFDIDFRLNAYDLGNKILYSGIFQDLDIYYHLMHCVKSIYDKPLFIHLAGDLFSIIWISNERWPVDDTTGWNCRSVLHCTNFRVSKFSHKQGIFSLSASVESCRTYVVKRNHVLHYIHGYQLK